MPEEKRGGFSRFFPCVPRPSRRRRPPRPFPHPPHLLFHRQTHPQRVLTTIFLYIYSSSTSTDATLSAPKVRLWQASDSFLSFLSNHFPSTHIVSSHHPGDSGVLNLNLNYNLFLWLLLHSHLLGGHPARKSLNTSSNRSHSAHHNHNWTPILTAFLPSLHPIPLSTVQYQKTKSFTTIRRSTDLHPPLAQLPPPFGLATSQIRNGQTYQ